MQGREWGWEVSYHIHDPFQIRYLFLADKILKESNRGIFDLTILSTNKTNVISGHPKYTVIPLYVPRVSGDHVPRVSGVQQTD